MAYAQAIHTLTPCGLKLSLQFLYHILLEITSTEVLLDHHGFMMHLHSCEVFMGEYNFNTVPEISSKRRYMITSLFDSVKFFPINILILLSSNSVENLDNEGQNGYKKIQMVEAI